MNRHPGRLLRPLVIAAALSPVPAWSAVAIAEKRDEPPAERESPFSLELTGGMQYDSNVSIPEIDAASSEGDQAMVLDADMGYRLEPGKDTDLDLSYRISQSLHDDFSEFDIQNHMLSTDLAHDFGAVDAGTTLRYIATRLDNEAYLEMRQFSPWIQRFFGRSVFVRGDYTLTDKDFVDLQPRDATQHAVGADAYWFFNGARTYVAGGYRYRDEDAEDAQFDYRSHGFKLRVSQRFRVLEHEAQAKLGWQYEARDYRSITPLIGQKREDDRSRVQAEVEVELGPRSFAVLEYEYGDYGSDLPSADYDQYLVGLRFGFRI